MLTDVIPPTMDPSLENKPGGDSAAAPPDKTTLLSSGKVMAELTPDFFKGQANPADKEKLASAATDMLGAASYYGNLNDKGYGKYVEKAEVYLKQYGGGGGGGTGGGAAPPVQAAATDAADAPKTDAVGSFLAGDGGGKAGNSTGGGLSGDVMKMAGGFFK